MTEVAQTTTGNVMGTAAYLAPELITSGDSAPRADVFSVGVILYELLTGEQPFSADSPVQIGFDMLFFPTSKPRRRRRLLP